ncbi:MAG: DUF1415 domain-containing protein [Rhodocyclaceae bacterium]|nr:DUF1415 domain-containing protein [Rhodocyclaceae bacterium]
MSELAAAVERWLDEVVIGLELCPFAAAPRRRGRVRIALVLPADEDALTAALEAELERLAATAAEELETTLLAIDGLLGDFDDYLRYLDFAELLLRQYGWQGTFQIASFHPHYVFAGSDEDDPANLTNRSPCPLLHLIREDSLSRVLARHPDPDAIPATNIQRMHDLSPAQRARLFPYLLG